MSELKRYGPLFVALWGWAALALALAQTPPAVVLAVVGLAAALLQSRGFGTSVVVEGAALVGVIWFAPLAQIGFVALGVGLVVIARALAVVARRHPD